MSIRCWFRHKWEDMGTSQRGGHVFKCQRCPKTKHEPAPAILAGAFSSATAGRQCGKTEATHTLMEQEIAKIAWSYDDLVKQLVEEKKFEHELAESLGLAEGALNVKPGTIWPIEPGPTYEPFSEHIVAPGHTLLLENFSNLEGVSVPRIEILAIEKSKITVELDDTGHGLRVRWEPSLESESGAGTTQHQSPLRCQRCRAELLCDSSGRTVQCSCWDNAPILAAIMSRDGHTYGWQQIVPDEQLTGSPGWRAPGTGVRGWAQEINNSSSVPIGTKVYVYSNGPDFHFSYPIGGCE